MRKEPPVICHIPEHVSRRFVPVSLDPRAIRLGPGGPGSRICVFEDDWDRVDEARMQADTAGISDRVSVHHASVLEWCRPVR